MGKNACLWPWKGNYDAFLVDVNMPGLGGIELCKRLRDIDRFKTTPIIFITTLEEDSNLEYAFQAGATDFISKPVNPVILKARLNAHLEKVSYF